ncbi:MAG: aldo/keto reductase [Prevotella sp.]|nr:aldo/keto reductase [Prevotella sp.]
MKIVLGTMNFGPQLDLEGSRNMVNAFLDSGNRELDTAYVYNGGATENILGDILPGIDSNSYEIATKVHPRITGRLDRETILMELNESLKRMKRDSVNLLYFHFPDAKTPIEEALETVAELYEKGVVKELGLSNYPAWQVVDIAWKCDKAGCPRPSVYQGMYNSLCRNVEPELFPAIRSLGMRFYAFNPLAGGMLTGKHKNYDDKPQPGRFERLESYRKRYWKQSYFDAVEEIRKACEAEGIPMAEAAYRWLCCHSLMDESKGDGILLGASRQEQMAQNMAAVEKGDLPQTIREAMDEAWELAKPDSPQYFKFI